MGLQRHTETLPRSRELREEEHTPAAERSGWGDAPVPHSPPGTPHPAPAASQPLSLILKDV